MSTPLDTLRASLALCRSLAREQGWEGADAEYQYTAEDLHFVTDEIGRKPTREEWAEAGIRWVGEDHVGDE